MKKFTFCLTAIVLTILLSSEIFGVNKYARLGAGEPTGLYYETGGVLSQLFQNNIKKHGVGLAVEQTAGSVYNINAVLDGKMEFGLAQSDREYQAYHGMINSEWEGLGPQKKLRSLFSLYTESVILLAPMRSQVTHIRDLKGLRVNMGTRGSGPLRNARDVLASFGMAEHMLKARHLSMSKAITFMREGGMEASFYTVGHPSSVVKLASKGGVKMRLVEISGLMLKGLFKRYPYYLKTTIPVSFYCVAWV